MVKADGTIALPPADAEALAGTFGKNAGLAAGLIKHLKTYIANLESMVTDMAKDGKQMETMIRELDTNTKDVMMRSAGNRAQRFDTAWETQFRPSMTKMQYRMEQEFVPWMKKVDKELTDFKGLMVQMQTALTEAQRELGAFARDMTAAGS